MTNAELKFIELVPSQLKAIAKQLAILNEKLCAKQSPTASKVNAAQNYYDAYKAMKEAAIEKMKNYGKTLEVIEVCKQRLMNNKGYANVDEITEDELENIRYNEAFSCFFTGKHGVIYGPQILMVRYNDETKDVDVYLETDEGDIDGWYPVSWVNNPETAYLTVLEFID